MLSSTRARYSLESTKLKYLKCIIFYQGVDLESYLFFWPLGTAKNLSVQPEAVHNLLWPTTTTKPINA